MNNYSSVIKQKVLKAISKYKMLENTTTVIVGFSGGADSVCLLHLLNSIRDELKITVRAAHINHGIRGAEAKRDADFARSFCETYGIPFDLLEADCPAEAEKSGETLEECGRRIRYNFFAELCDDMSKTATAHNANDDAETILFNIIRGSGLKGICGIPPVRGNIIRPLILCSRDEIEGYCNENNLSFVTDSTNLSDDYTRNKIRHLVIPAMESINSAAVENITAFGTRAKEVDEFVVTKASELLARACVDGSYYNTEIFLKECKAVVTQALIIAFKDFSGKSIDSRKVELIYNLLTTNGRVQLYGDIYAEVLKNRLRFFENTTTENNYSVRVEGLPFKYSSTHFTVKIDKYTDYSKKFNKKLLDNFADCDKIVGCLYLRTRRSGDEFTFADRKLTKSLKKIFNEMQIPIELRCELPVLCDDSGVVWVYGIGVNSRCRIDGTTSNIICLRGEDNDN